MHSWIVKLDLSLFRKKSLSRILEPYLYVKIKLVIIEKVRREWLIMYSIVLINNQNNINPLVLSHNLSLKAVEYQQEISWSMAPFRDDIYDLVIR